MASSFTYAQLKAALQNWVEDQGATFASDVDVVIKLAEDKVLKGLQLSIFDANETITGIDAAVESKPTGTILTRSLYLTVAGSITYVEKRSKTFIEAYWPTPATLGSGAPRFFADDYSTTQWLFGPTPATAYSGVATVVKRPTSLVTDTSGTWLSQNVGDLLFKAAQIEANIYAVADERLETLRKEYGHALVVNRYDLRDLARTDNGSLSAQPQAKGER